MDHPYASFVGSVEKPSRYLGGEYHSARKDWDAAEVRFVLAFPDLYDIGMSHLGTKILYALLNRHEKILCERAFAPWADMEAELRRRGLPLLSLESARPLSQFDAIGCSLQFELTYSNVLTLLDLGGVPLRAAARGEQDPIVWGGGPTATHPEPVAPFFDCFLIGDAEEVLPDLLIADAENRRRGLTRQERLRRLAAHGSVYVPSLYATALDPTTGLEVVDRPRTPEAPPKIRRAVVADLDAHPFPDDPPVAWAEAVFDRASIEIARGCTEGCRFCQAGMIYRPVRERSPSSIVQAAVSSVERGGYDETSLTSLSTADFSCITPLVGKVATALRARKVSLSVSSLRAYGLGEELLDEIASVRATGLTFAPEAGTQRMRDVINKNVTEADIAAATDRILARGWSRMKLYFMIGLPTETDEDVIAIAQTGGRLLRRGKKLRSDASITVSVSSHVPKPHTPFQWCAMDSEAELARKQRLLRETAHHERIELKWHDPGGSWLEGIFARGDRRLADTLETAWRRGARFDGWEEQLKLDVWHAALAEHRIDPAVYLGALPIDARLPWDHIDIGLEDDFLAAEYRRALKNRLSPPCGKPHHTLLHPTNLEAALADQRKLVCYDCGIACDLTKMRDDRILALRQLGAERPPPAKSAPPAVTEPRERRRCHPKPAFEQGPGTRYRIAYTKLGRAAFISHLDTGRLLQRVFRRAGVETIYSRGFHPKPEMAFGPALGLGIAALDELVDVLIDGAPDAEELRGRLCHTAPEGLTFTRVARLTADDAGLARLVGLGDYAALLVGESRSRVATLAEQAPQPVSRLRKGERRMIDVASYLVSLSLADPETEQRLARRLTWPPVPLLVFRLRLGSQGGAKPSEIVASLAGTVPADVRYARLALWALPASPRESAIDLFDLEALRHAASRRTAARPGADEREQRA